jgi:hypothetical protein
MHTVRLIAPLLASLVACAPSAVRLPGTPPSIEGRLTSVNPSGEHRGSIRVEAVPEDSAGSAKAVVRVTESTAIRSGEEAVGFAALRTGHWVRVWFTGPVRESYPLQADAAFIQLDPER